MNFQSGNNDKNWKAPRRTGPESRSATAIRSKDEITLSELRQILGRRRAPLFVCIALGILGAIVVSVCLPTRYEAVARLTVDMEPSRGAGVEALAEAAGVADATILQTQVSILQTDSLAWELIRTLRLDQRQETVPRSFLGSPVCRSAADQSIDKVSTECRQQLLDEFRKRLHVQSIPRTDIIEIRYRCRSRELAAQIVNTMTALYVERNFQSKYQSALKSSGWLAEQLEGVKKDAQAAQNKLLKYREQTGVTGIEGGPSLLLAHLSGLNQQLVAAESERIVQEALYRTALTGDPEALDTTGSTLQVLHSEEVALQNQYAQLEPKYGDAYPRVIQIKEQLAKAQEATAAELQHTVVKLKNLYEAGLKNEQLLRTEVQRQKQLLYASDEAGMQAALLSRDVEASNELYKQVVKRLKTGGILAGVNGPDITIIDPAAVPAVKAEPHAALNLLAGIAVGSLFGLALCGLLEGSDTRIATMNEVMELCPLAGVGIIPCLNGKRPLSRLASPANRNGLTGIEALEQPASPTADAYRSLRTALIHAGSGVSPKVILITSPLSREGKTAASANLAVVFAQMNRRVLLVDADLRRRSLSCTFDCLRAGGLSRALAGEDHRPYCLSQPRLPGLYILPAGDGQFNPPDLLDSPRMRELIAQWRAEYDDVIIDAPHVIGLSDSVILSTMVDTVVLAVRTGHSRRNDINSVIEVLNSVGASLSGAVVMDMGTGGLSADARSRSHQHSTELGTEYGNAPV